jgi:dihydrofolate reductase
MIRLIAVVDSRNGLAKDGNQPWDIPEDLARFRSLTTSGGSNILIGYTTYKTIGRLEDRNNYVVSRSHLENTDKDIIMVPDLEKFLDEFDQDLWVIGGAEIYKQSLRFADEVYLTVIDHDFECDKFFPEINDGFKLISTSEPIIQNSLTFRYKLYKK